MANYKLFFVAVVFFFCSCEQMLRSVAEQSAKSSQLIDSLKFEYNEKPIASDRQDIIERRKQGPDSLYLVRSYFLNGKMYCEGWYKNDQQHGISTFYTTSGKVQYTMQYKDGKMYSLLSSFDLKGNKNDGGNLKEGNGNIRIYHPVTGNLVYKTTYKNGLIHGTFESFFSDAKKSEQYTFTNGTRTGEFVAYYHSGTIKEKGNMDLLTITGVVESFYPNGKKQSYEKWDNGSQLTLKEYDERGYVSKEKNRINGQLIGTKYYYSYKGKLLSKGDMLDDKKHGRYEYFYENGKLKRLETYSNDTILSETLWNENGTLSVENVYKNGMKNGICKEYYITGNIRVEQMYVNDVEEGMYKSYFNSGKLYNDGQFKNGELSGDLKYYSEKGQLTQTKKYN